MALPRKTITPIPNNEPDAVPALWNTRYSEIDENFSSLDSRMTARESEIALARNGKPSLDARLGTMESNISATSVDMQNASGAALKFALDQAALANYSIKALKQQLQQEGELTIENKGVVFGCVATKSATAARNLTLSTGVCFANGRTYSVADAANAASVPPNIGNSNVTASAYLYLDGDKWKLAVTALGQAVPGNAIRLYTLTIPANSTDATDPNLLGVTLTDVRRIEPQFPTVMNSAVSVSTALNTLSENDYRLTFDVVTATGAPCEPRHIIPSSRATNGFTVTLASAADNVLVRWRASKLNN
ncbi:hypothetical protein AKG95_21725 [Janthinobacterium lividum]|uniref:Uncharacterized protein n=1 Tax=Janthinobacterium lividum TaxID=29581 RepID=A0A1S1U395_9BURK|nr:hypothetical protein [Janthinobacterium lividum]OHV94922.1 hypothetical protein AKG95_21725 [Janthinobacterium lividum]